MPVKLNGATSGSVTIDAPAVAGTNTLTLPAVTDTLVGVAATQTLTGKTLTSPTITGAVVSSMGSSVLTSGTVNAGGTNPFPAVSGPTVVDFTGIPSWVKRITVTFGGISISGTSNVIIQLGDSGGVETTGYLGSAVTVSGTSSINNANYTTGFGLTGIPAPSAGLITHGTVTITTLDPASNLWACAGIMGISTSAGASLIGASKTLSATLDRIRITTLNGTDTFDAGSINILYE